MLLLLGLLTYVWGGWGMYVVVMAVYRMHLAGKLCTPSYVMAAPFVAFGLILDVLGNFTLCWLLFLDRPREWTITARLRRYNRKSDGWRHKVADWICKNALDPFDARDGEHC